MCELLIDIVLCG